jgi:hypothetical protein
MKDCPYYKYYNQKDIRSYDKNDTQHGYNETYEGPHPEDAIWLRVNYVHGKETGYEEYFGDQETTFYIR